MDMQILIDEAKLPAQNSETWVLPVLDGGVRREWLVDGFDLALWFKEAMGRYPAHEKGDGDTRDDLKANWPQVEKRFYQELEKQVELGTTITVDGARISALEWERVRMLPAEELPPLTESQREIARKMKVPEQEYSRNFLAMERGRTRLLEKAERLARFLREQLKRLDSRAVVQRVALSTIEHGFEIDLVEEGIHIPVRIREEIVDDFFEGGSSDAEARIIRILETAVKYRHRVIQ